MNTKMYVGNLPFSATEDDIRSLFSEHGVVTDVFLPMDRDTGRPRGFAFVTMDSASSMEAAIRGQNGKDFGGRNLAINEARPKEERPTAVVAAAAVAVAAAAVVAAATAASGYGGGGGGGGRGGYGGGGGGGGGGGRDRY
jgi:cold-inducible RNA-binding protein